jgi:hypothetical protein
MSGTTRLERHVSCRKAEFGGKLLPYIMLLMLLMLGPLA